MKSRKIRFVEFLSNPYTMILMNTENNEKMIIVALINDTITESKPEQLSGCVLYIVDHPLWIL